MIALTRGLSPIRSISWTASCGSLVETAIADDQALVAGDPVLQRPVVEGAAERGGEVGIGEDRGAVDARPGQQGVVDVPEVEVLVAQLLVGRCRRVDIVLRAVAVAVEPE